MAGSNAGAGGIYNQVNFNLYHYANNNPVKYMDPTGMELEEGASVVRQLDYLQSIANAEYASPQDKANAAKGLRDEMQGSGKNNFNLNELFYGKDGDERFMNETLRDFLNTSDSGEDYAINDMTKSDWNIMEWPGNSEHQHNQNGGPNIKYVNKDGREAVFDANRNLIKGGLDAGTYNYGKSGWTSGSAHGKYDMKPFFRQNNIKPSYWLTDPLKGSPYGLNTLNRYLSARGGFFL